MILSKKISIPREYERLIQENKIFHQEKYHFLLFRHQKEKDGMRSGVQNCFFGVEELPAWSSELHAWG